MKPLADTCTASGYTVVTCTTDTCAEVSGNGSWARLERVLRHHLERSFHDHISIILRDEWGGRILRDIGTGVTRDSLLIPVSTRSRTAPPPKTGYWGVKQYRTRDGRVRYTAQVTSHHGEASWLGVYDTAIEAAQAHDRYCVEHHLGVHARINFPVEMQEEVA